MWTIYGNNKLLEVYETKTCTNIAQDRHKEQEGRTKENVKEENTRGGKRVILSQTEKNGEGARQAGKI